MAPCTCILDDGSTCGTPTRVRIGREYQAESGWAPPCPDCKRAGRIPQSGKRSPAGRENMSKAREALFVHPRTLLAHTLAEQGAERLGAFLRSGAAMVKRDRDRAEAAGRTYSATQEKRTKSGAKSRAARGRAGPPRKDETREQLRKILAELGADYGDEMRDLSRNSILACVGMVAWQRRVDSFRSDYSASPDDPECHAREYRESVLRRVGGLIGEDVKALLTAGK